MNAEEFVKKIDVNRLRERAALVDEGFSPEGAKMHTYLTEKLEKERDIAVPGQPELTELLRKYYPPLGLFGELGFTIEENMKPHEAGFQIGDEDSDPIVAIEETGEIAIFNQEINGGGIFCKLAKDGAAFLDVLAHLSSVQAEREDHAHIIRKDIDKAIELAGGPEYGVYYENAYYDTVEYEQNNPDT